MAKLRFHLLPHADSFFETFDRTSENVLDGAHALADLLENYTDVEHKVRRLKDIEHRGDELTHTTLDALDRSFVTPFDRDDVARLAAALDDFIDWIEEASLRLFVYKIAEPTVLARRFGRIIVEQAQSIRRAVPLLRDMKQHETIHREIVEMHRLENEGDDLMVQALGTLYEGVQDVPALIRAVQWGDIYEVLESATDKAEHVGNALESIIVKHS